MTRTDHKVAIRLLTAVLALAGLLFLGGLILRSVVENFNRNHARQLVLRLQAAEIVKVPETIAEMEVYRQWTDPLLIALLEKSEHDPARKLLRGALPSWPAIPHRPITFREGSSTPRPQSFQCCVNSADRGAARAETRRFWKRTARMTDESWDYRPRRLTSIAIARNGRVPQAGSRVRDGFRESDRRE